MQAAALEQYAEIQLGSSSQEVYYRLGLPAQVMGPYFPDDAPSPGVLPDGPRYRALFRTAEDAPAAEAVPKGKKLFDFDGWVYEPSDNGGEVQVDFKGKPATVEAVTCYASGKQKCPARLQIGIGTTEDEIVALLGKPDATSYIRDVKLLTYKRLKSEFVLERQRVYGIRAQRGASSE